MERKEWLIAASLFCAFLALMMLYVELKTDREFNDQIQDTLDQINNNQFTLRNNQEILQEDIVYFINESCGR